MDDQNVKQPEFDRSIGFITESLSKISSAVETLAEVSAKTEVSNARFMEHIKNNQERHDTDITDVKQRLRPLEKMSIENNLKWKLTTFLSGAAVAASISNLIKSAFFS